MLALDVRWMREFDERWFFKVGPLDDFLLLAIMHTVRLRLRGIPEAERAGSRDGCPASASSRNESARLRSGGIPSVA